MIPERKKKELPPNVFRGREFFGVPDAGKYAVNKRKTQIKLSSSIQAFLVELRGVEPLTF